MVGNDDRFMGLVFAIYDVVNIIYRVFTIRWGSIELRFMMVG